jgi:putative SOS response-associated peptidase YedK
MCNLYELHVEGLNRFFAKSLAQVLAGENVPPMQIYPGNPGIVITADRLAKKMTWGFPLILKGKDGKPLKPKPVNNARTDRLGSPFWNCSIRERRCLIPLDRFAEAEGAKGAKTTTYYSVADNEQFHCAGLWRESTEWGKVYAMVMTEAAGPVERIHDRMPVILPPDSYDDWLTGSAEDVKRLCVPWDGDLQEERTGDLWVKR